MPYSQLTESCREKIARLRRQGLGNNQIARQLGRDPSTVSRELRRNAKANGRYEAPHAQNKTRDRRRAAGRSRRKLTGDPRLRRKVEHRLGNLKRSPESIAHELGSVSHETIYQHVYRSAREHGSKLWRCLDSPRRRRRPRRRREAEKRGRIQHATPLAQRPQEANLRQRPGDYEADTLHGPTPASLVTINDRATRFTRLRRVDDRQSPTVTRAMVAMLKPEPRSARHSLAVDNGKEFAMHVNLTARTGLPVFFCDPHSPWQRGANEQRNRLVRRYFPKGTDFARVTDARVARVEKIINNTPMQVLGWCTPVEARKHALSGVALQP